MSKCLLQSLIQVAPVLVICSSPGITVSALAGETVLASTETVPTAFAVDTVIINDAETAIAVPQQLIEAISSSATISTDANDLLYHAVDTPDAAHAEALVPVSVSDLPSELSSHLAAPQTASSQDSAISASQQFNPLTATHVEQSIRLSSISPSESATSSELPGVAAEPMDPSSETVTEGLEEELTPTPSLSQNSPPPTDSPTTAPPAFVPSRALNILVLRSLRKPVGNRVLDTGVQSAGIRPRDTSESFWTRDFLTGNWGGLRDELYQQGIDIYLTHFVEFYSNVAGGEEEASTYNGVTVGGIDLYTSRLGWWEGGQIHITAALLEGNSVGRDYAGALNSTFFGDPAEHGPRLFELWYGQRFAGDRGEVRIGKIYPFVRIAPSQVAGVFTNSSFGYPGFLGTTPQNGLTATYPAAPFGIQVSYTLSPEWFLIGQIQDGFDDPSGGIENRSGLSIGLSEDEGIEGIFEAVYRLNQRPGSTGLPGNYRVGVQFHTGEFLSNHENVYGESLALEGGQARTHRGNSAFYLVADQMVLRESPDPTDRTQGLSAFFKTLFTPEDDINTVSFHISGGLAYEGLIPGRDRDVLGLAVSYTRISDGLREYDRDLRRGGSDITIRDAETVIELVYAAEIAPWWVLVGSLQQIIHPSGNSSIPDATVLGISSRFSF